MARLKKIYSDQIAPAMREEFKYANTMETPRITKVVVNMGVGEAALNKKLIEGAVTDMTLIAGQKPLVTKARKSVANFKLREGMPVGCKVTLRRDRMWEFLDHLINIALPRVRDFNGVSGKGFDGRGNYSLGIKEQIIFPEVDYDKVDKIRGMNITICTTAKTDNEGRTLLKHFSMPFRN